MKVWLLRVGTVLALAFLALTFVNASWLADSPRGHLRQIAHRSIAPYYDPAGGKPGDCVATRIEQPSHDYIEDTLASLRAASGLAASLIEVDVVPTADGQIVAFPDEALDCRTDSAGPVRAKTLAELQALDVGYGYTADGGKSFPLRGKGAGMMPSLEQVLRALPDNGILFHFTAGEPGDADRLARALKAAGRDVAKHRDAFHGTPAQVERIHAQFPKAWAWSDESAGKCSDDYTRYGWTGIMPASCTNGTLLVALDGQWKVWGWPDRAIARMEEVGGRIIVTGSQEPAMSGIGLPEQLADVPATFNGYLWVDDLWNIGPALHPASDRRGPRASDLAEKALAARRAKLQ